MRRFNIQMALSLLCFFGVVASRAAETKRPNIILVLADDLGWADLGCTGSTYYETPNLDALAANGMMFTHAYSPAPVCTPSRGAMLSGWLPARTKLMNVFFGKSAPDDRLYNVSKEIGLNNQNLEAKHRHTLTSEAVTYPQRLKEAGYTTGFIGTWHIGVKDGYRPEQRGYEMAAGYYRESDSISAEHYITSTTELVNLPQAKPGDWRADRLAEAACGFIENHKDVPFLLNYNSYLTHGPYVGKNQGIGKYEQKKKTHQTNAKYASMVESLDESVGKIVAQLKRLNLLDHTLIIFTSDNGGCGATSNYPLMGGKSFSYEGGYRVPFIAHWPQRIQAGARSDTRVIGVDLYPTFLEVAGALPKPDYVLDGVSLMGELMGTAKLAKRPLYFHFPHYTHATSPHSIVIAEGWKLIRYYNDAKGRYALFNLEEDPFEQNDLNQTHPEKVQQLDTMLQDRLVSVDASFPIPASSEAGATLIRRFLAKGVTGEKPKNKASERAMALGMRKRAEAHLNQ